MTQLNVGWICWRIKILRLHYAREIWKWHFSLQKRIKCFPSTTPEKCENAAITVGSRKSLSALLRVRMIIKTSSLWKTSVFKMVLRSALKHRAGIFKFLRFEEFFRNAPFSVRISVDCWPNRRNKVAFSNFSGVVWTRPQCFCSDRENSRGPVYKFTDGERVQYFPKRKWRKFIYHLMGLLKVC